MLNITTACSLFLLEAGNALADTETESLLNNEYTQELKQGASHAWSTIFSTRFFYAILLLVIMFALFKAVDMVVKPLRRRYSSPFLSFLAGAVKAVIGVVFVLRIMNLFTLLSGLTEQILMSSSLLVVVAGFVFQEGLTNIVHGFILSVSKPFQIGDRVTCQMLIVRQLVCKDDAIGIDPVRESFAFEVGADFGRLLQQPEHAARHTLQ